MMPTRERLIRLAERRTLLQARAQAERERLAAALERSDEVSALLRRAQGVARELLEQLQRRPWIAAAVVGALVALRPRRMLGLAARGWSLWRLYRSAYRWYRQFADRPAGAA